jgi:hypothetical protein
LFSLDHANQIACCRGKDPLLTIIENAVDEASKPILSLVIKDARKHQFSRLTMVWE